MSEPRPFPPSPRRIALARQAGLTAASPMIVGALACGAALVAATWVGREAARQIGAWIVSAADGSHGEPLGLGGVAHAVLSLAAPVLIAAAAVACVAHIAQTRGLWLPRRRVAGAPTLNNGPAQRVGRAAFDMGSAVVMGAVVVGWLWSTARDLAALMESGSGSVSAHVGAALASLVVALTVAWLGLGVVDALLRRVALARALAMTTREKREDDRLAAADPRWRDVRRAAARADDVALAVTRAAVVIVGDDLGVAVAWDPVRQPLPLRTASGRHARATQIVALARRHGIAVHLDAPLASALVGDDGPVPEALWARLAEIVAAVRR